MRARIDIAEIEATTKIRAKYLRALENEEWGLLPGYTFVKRFLRTYADTLGPRRQARWSRSTGAAPASLSRRDGARRSRIVRERRTASQPQRPPAGRSRGYMIAVGSVLVVIVLLGRAAGRGQRRSNIEDMHDLRPRAIDASRHSHTQGSTGSSGAGSPRRSSLSLHANCGRLRVPGRGRRRAS